MEALVAESYPEHRLPTSSPANFDVLNTHAFLNRFRQVVGEEDKRVWVKAMYFRPGEEMPGMFAGELRGAGHRGVDARLQLDKYTNLRFELEKIRAREELDSLGASGVRVELVGSDSLLRHALPELGCDHRKAVVVGNRGWLIGLNLSDDNYRSADLAVEMWDERLVEGLVRVFEGRPAEDREQQCINDTSLLEDAGRVGHSLILDRAEDVIGEAKHSVKMISPYLPDWRVLRAMSKRREKGVEVEVVVPPYAIKRSRSVFGMVNEFARFSARMKGWEVPIRLHQRWNHTKLLIVDDELAITGSCAFTTVAPWVGTAELSMQSTNSLLVNNLMNFYEMMSENSSPFASK